MSSYVYVCVYVEKKTVIMCNTNALCNKTEWVLKEKKKKNVEENCINTHTNLDVGDNLHHHFI